MNDQVYGCITGKLLFWQLDTYLHCKCACNWVHKAEMFTAKGDVLGNSAVQGHWLLLTYTGMHLFSFSFLNPSCFSKKKNPSC